MRIAQLTAWYPPHSIGGTEIYVEALVAAVRRAGHDVMVAGPLAGIDTPQWSIHAGTRVLRYPVPASPSRDEARGRVRARTSGALVDWLREWQPDVVHVHSLTTGLHVPELAAAAGGAGVVLTAHLPSLTYICQRGTLALWGREACDGIREARRCAACSLQQRGVPEPLARLVSRVPLSTARRARDWSGRLGTALAMPALIEDLAISQEELFALVDAVVVLNNTARNILWKNGAPDAKVVVNPLGISHSARPKPSPDRAPTGSPVRVGYFGRLSRDKGIEDLLTAIERLSDAEPITFTFHGIPEGTDGERLAAKIQRLASSRRGVALKPPIAPAAVPAALAAIDVLCAPSRWFENGPTIALEAMAAGTPVIGTRLGAFADFVEDGVNGRLVDPGDTAALASALREVARDPAGTIDRWRRRLPPVRTMREISADYLRLYDRIAARESRAAGR